MSAPQDVQNMSVQQCMTILHNTLPYFTLFSEVNFNFLSKVFYRDKDKEYMKVCSTMLQSARSVVNCYGNVLSCYYAPPAPFIQQPKCYQECTCIIRYQPSRRHSAKESPDEYHSYIIISER